MSILGIILLALQDRNRTTKTTKPDNTPRPERTQWYIRGLGYDEYWWRRGRGATQGVGPEDRLETLRLRYRMDGNNYTRSLVENWRRSITGLIKLAEGNLREASEYLKNSRYEEALNKASTGVENVARALIHCCGGKPDPEPGQEEPLRMLSHRFRGTERIEFEKAVEDIACIGHNRIAQKYLSTHNMQTQLLDKARASQILETASEVVGLFKRIITERYNQEIQERLSTKA